MSAQGDACALVDAYLLGEAVSKPAVIAAVLAAPASHNAVAAPFYRALQAIGIRAADESLIALRLVLAGQAVSDSRVRRMRCLSRLLWAAAGGQPDAVIAALQKEEMILGEVLAECEPADITAIQAAARRAYFAELDVE